ncbi:ras and Rab interactor 3 [Eucyclogobius newberryi]|uniref:ras and Rab interactor 3 n=1 Tax=Eucyclogobius newberryi TaxID=166745 RepID=UPI003B5C30A1
MSPSANPSRPFRPKPPPPPTPKPPATSSPRSPSLKTPCFNPPPNLPPPLSPTPASPTSPASTTPETPADPSSAAAFDPLTSPEASGPGLMDKVWQSASTWRTGLSQERVFGILKEELPGVFLVHGADETSMTLSVRARDPHEPAVQSLTVKRHGTFLHLDGSFLVFDDIFKLVSFYCVSRDVLPVSLRFPRAIATATDREALEVIAAAGKDFWTSDLHLQSKVDGGGGGEPSGTYLHLNPIVVAGNPIRRDEPDASASEADATASQNAAASPLPNGDAPEKVDPEVRGHDKPHRGSEMKYKRPPPRRPPSVSGGMGLLFSSAPSTQAPATADRKDEAKAVEEKNEKKPTANAPSRPPMPQSRAGPPLPRAPLRSSRKSSDGERERAEGTEREKGHHLTKQDEKEGAVGAEPGELSERIGPGRSEKESGCQQQREEVDAGKDATEGKQKSSVVKKPSRPVPPPRRKPQAPESPAGPTQAGAAGGPGGASRLPPPSPGRRPDVSLYSPQGGAVLVTDADSASTSSTDEEAEAPDQSCGPESRSPKPRVKRTPTTVILDRARHRLSTVLTGLISHDRRLTQKIVELARDPSSYFGNLVKEHRTFTLETMSRHASPTELLQEIRQMMTQLKIYLLQSTELHAMMEQQHLYAQDKLESIAEAALCKSVLKPLREPIYQCLEKLHNESGSLEKLAQNQSVVLGSTTTALGVTTSVPEASAMEKISIKLSNLHLEYSPQRKIEMLLKACKVIYDSMAVSSPGRAHGADDFLPVMMYVVARCNLSDLRLDVEYMMELMDPALTLGEGSYYLTTTYGALEHIKTFDQQRSATRQLSREVQDSIHRWERRRTLNKESTAQTSVRDFLTVCCPIMDENPKTLGVFPATSIEQLREQCASRFEQEISEHGHFDPDSFILSVVIDDEHRPLAPTEMALCVKNSCSPGAFCFVFHPEDQPAARPARSGPKGPPPAPPPTSPPAAPPPALSSSTVPPSTPPPIPTPPSTAPNVPPPPSTTPSAPPPICAQRSAPCPVSPPVRPPNVPPPTPTTPSAPPPISAQRSRPVPPPVRPPNVPPTMAPPKTPPPSVQPISVPTSVNPAPPPPSRPPSLPPPVPSPPSVPPPVPSPSPAPASVAPSTPPPTPGAPPEEPPPIPPPTVSPPPESTSLGDAEAAEPEAAEPEAAEPEAAEPEAAEPEAAEPEAAEPEAAEPEAAEPEAAEPEAAEPEAAEPEAAEPEAAEPEAAEPEAEGAEDESLISL